VSDLSLSLSHPLSLSSYFLSPVQLRRESDRAVLVGTWHLSRPNQNRDVRGALAVVLLLRGSAALPRAWGLRRASAPALRGCLANEDHFDRTGLAVSFSVVFEKNWQEGTNLGQ